MRRVGVSLCVPLLAGLWRLVGLGIRSGWNGFGYGLRKITNIMVRYGYRLLYQLAGHSSKQLNRAIFPVEE
jgi:hypothetical protein